MSDTPLSSEGLWFVTLAREALNEGHRVIAHDLNSVLREMAPDVCINTNRMRKGDSLWHAAEQFRQALPGLRTTAPLPPRDSDVIVWTLGYINWTNNQQCFVTVDGIGSTGQFDLTPKCNFLRERRSHWPPSVWRECIQAPVEELYSSNLAALQQPACDVGITLFDLAFLIEEDEAAASSLVKRWVDSKHLRAKPIGKCPLDGRRLLYGLSELLSDVGRILALDAREQTKYRQALTAKLRTPKR